MELLATILNAVLGTLSVSIVYYTVKIGLNTGFVTPWKYISVGFGAMAIGEFFLALAVFTSDCGAVKIEPVMRDYGLMIMIAATAVMLAGQRGVSKSVNDLIGEHKHG